VQVATLTHNLHAMESAEPLVGERDSANQRSHVVRGYQTVDVTGPARPTQLAGEGSVLRERLPAAGPVALCQSIERQ
jgi:hypothetical protein